MDYSSWGQLRCVHAGELEEATRAGWKLLAIVPSSHVIPGSTGSIQVGDQYGSNGRDMRFEVPWPATVESQPLFLVGLPEASVQASLSEQVKAGLEDGQALRVQLTKRDQEIRDLRHDVSGLRATVANQREQMEQLQRTKEAHAKLEKDLAKVRTAIGSQAMNEILSRTPE